VLTYAKTHPSADDRIVCIISLDPAEVVNTWIHLDLGVLGFEEGEPFSVTELITGSTWTWTGAHHPIEMDPSVGPAWILALSDITQ
jgi:starch synthase (maltosyl-transferring)